MTFPRLARLTERFDDRLRFRDLKEHRTVGGRLDVRYGIRRHTLPALMLPSLLCAVLILATPSALRVGLAAVVAIVVFQGLRRLMAYSDMQNRPLRYDLWFQAGIVLLTAAAVWTGPSEFQPSGLYRHLFVPIAVALSVALVGASALVVMTFHPLCEVSRYDEYLETTELFSERGPAPVVTGGTIAAAVSMALLRAPLQLLTVPAIVALLLPPQWLWQITLAVVFVFFVALAFAGLNERFGAMWDLSQSVFFKGGSLIVSVIVIALGGARLAGVSYVTTVFDASTGSIVIVALAGAYVLSWWYDYWASRLLSDQILGLLQRGVTGTASIPYMIDPDYVATAVPPDNRVVQIHGSGRLIAIATTATVTYFQSYSMTDLIDTLAIAGAPGGHAVPTPLQVRGRIFNFHSLAGLVFAVLIAVPAWVMQRGEQKPELVCQLHDGGVPVANLLEDASKSKDGRPLIVIAASGGGTRAALYTAAVLEGIQKLGRSADVVIGSGVSGGGASLAYFASNRPALIQGAAGDWNTYFDRMKQPYIQDVLERGLEWRTVHGGRLGILLANSFKSRWQLDPRRSRLDDIRDFGLILNTSLAGSLDLPQPAGNKSLSELEPKYRKDETSSALAGGRLILTNLDLPTDLAGQPVDPDLSHPLPVIIRSSDVRLETAAALNANFPPVFSNAAIDVDNKTRYWVTDGGAVDNRGLEMLLYAIRFALKDRKRGQLPRLYVIVADASGLSDHFTQDRGLSSAVGGGTRFASQLDSELRANIQDLYREAPGRFHFEYLMMPDRLRASDSFGTHWMLQGSIQVHHGDDRRTISGDEMIKVLRALHVPGADRVLSPSGCQILRWSREDPGRAAWKDLTTALGGEDPEPTCISK